MPIIQNSQCLESNPFILPGVSLHQPYENPRIGSTSISRRPLKWFGQAGGQVTIDAAPCVVMARYGYVSKLSQTMYIVVIYEHSFYYKSHQSESQKIMSMDSMWLIWQLLSWVLRTTHCFLLCALSGLLTWTAHIWCPTHRFLLIFFVIPNHHHL